MRFNTDQPIRIALIDEQLIFTESLADRINKTARMQVVGTAIDADDGRKVIFQTEPDIVLLDVELRNRGPFDLIAYLSARHPEMKVIFLTGHLSDVLIDRAIRLQAAGYVLKTEPFDALVNCIERVAAGESCFSEAVEHRLKYDSGRKKYKVHSHSPLMSLTERQLEVLRYLAKGQSSKEVAKSMHLSEKAIESHKYRIMRKLDIHDRVELARYAIREGLVPF